MEKTKGEAKGKAVLPEKRRAGASPGAPTLWLQVRMTGEERERWRAKAEAAGVSLSAYTRACLEAGGAPSLQRKPSRGPREIDPALARELARLGNNLNQIARWTHTRRCGPLESLRVMGALVELDREIALLRASYATGEAIAGEGPEC